MAIVYPGQELEITFGNGQKLKTKALTGKQQQEEFAPKFAELIRAEVSADVVSLVGIAKDLLDYIAGTEEADRLWAESVDSSMVLEIAQKVLARGRLDEDDEKKSGSPP